MTAYEIPLSPTPQVFVIALAGINYQLTIAWNTAMICWCLDIADVNGNNLVLGIPIITGLDLLAQYAYLGIGGHLVAQTDGSGSITATVDGGSPTPVVGPGDWVIVGASLVGDGSQLWGPSLTPSGASSGSLLQANIAPNDVPTAANLGIHSHLFFVVSP